MLEKLKEQVYLANVELQKRNLVILTWGNVSGFDPATGLIAIKPSGVAYEKLTPNAMVVMDLNGRVVEGDFSPSCDAPTHLELYKSYPSLKGIVHTHSTFATAFAQAGQAITPYGTTHADYFHREIVCTRALTAQETAANYEENTGKVIVETLMGRPLTENCGILVKGHGVFAWGAGPMAAVDHAQTIEQIAKMAFLTRQISPEAAPLESYILDKHYNRKHGKGAYYGQRGK